MHSLSRALATWLYCAALTTSLTAQSQGKPIDPANLDTTCSPCKNFFQYANGGWLKRSEIPGDQPRWGSFDELQEQNYAALKEVLTDAATNASSTKDANVRKLGTFYGTCMDSTVVERAGMGPLRGELNQIAAIHDRRGISGRTRSARPGLLHQDRFRIGENPRPVCRARREHASAFGSG